MHVDCAIHTAEGYVRGNNSKIFVNAATDTTQQRVPKSERWSPDLLAE